MLDRRVAAMSDFTEVFAHAAHQIQCAPVKITTNRRWVRLVGTRHDIQYWHPDDARIPRLFPFVRPFVPEKIGAGERWIVDILAQAQNGHNILKGVELFVPEKLYTDHDTYAHLAGYQIDRPQRPKPGADGKFLTPPEWDQAPNCYKCNVAFSFTNRQHHCRNCGHSYCTNCTPRLCQLPEYGFHNDPQRVCDACFVKLNEYKTLKEIIVYRKAKVVQVWNIEEHGRRYFRYCVFTTDTKWCLTDMKPTHADTATWTAFHRFSASLGHSYLKPSYPHPSLTITRNLSSLADGLQVYVPNRFLRGLIPDAILDEYVFWQETDDSLTGYLIKEIRDKMHTQTVIRVELLKDKNSLAAVARISRRPLRGVIPGVAAYEELPQHPVFLKKQAEVEKERELKARLARESASSSGGSSSVDASGDSKGEPVTPKGAPPPVPDKQKKPVRSSCLLSVVRVGDLITK